MKKVSKELRLEGLLLGTAILALLASVNVISAGIALSLVVCTSNLPEFYDEVVRPRKNFAEHLWASIGWPVWGVYACLKK